MPRQVRIEYPSAVYHVMARGDRREAIFRDEQDRKMFLDVLGQACGRTGWLCHAYVLMGNHYHLVVETPEANLVVGMAWVQNTFTRRHNLRHGLWGHLFGGRYKAVLVDPQEAMYFATLIDYVHLNPARAWLFELREGLESFPWSSLGGGYLVPASKRKPWLCAERGLNAGGFGDDARGRRAYLLHLEERARAEGREAGEALPEGQSLQSTLQRGWFFGSQRFKEKLLAVAKQALKAGARRKGYGAAGEVREHHLQRAAALVKAGMEVCELDEASLEALPCGEERKAVIALAVKSETTVPMDWIAERLHMGARSTVSREVGAMARRMRDDKSLQKRYRLIIAAAV